MIGVGRSSGDPSSQRRDKARTVAVAWNGLPDYAMRSIVRLKDRGDYQVSIISNATRRQHPSADEVEGTRVIWLGPDEGSSWVSLGLEVPTLFAFTGWCHPNFNRLVREVKQRGGVCVSMIDNSRKHNLRQAVGRLWFRSKFLKMIDYVFVPGEDGRQLMRYFGVPENQILTGLYGADPKVFKAGGPLLTRPIDFLFVGQLIPRKGLHTLMEAVESMRSAGHRFSLLCVGSGPMEDELRAARITVAPNCPSDQVAGYMKASKFLILPSLQDHWGVVVHESALSGCGLILSSGVASRFDLLTPDNGFQFTLGKSNELADCMIRSASCTEQWMARALRTSTALAESFSPERWAETICRLVNRADGCARLR